MIARIDAAKADGNTLGGICEVVARGAAGRPWLACELGSKARRSDRSGDALDPGSEGR